MDTMTNSLVFLFDLFQNFNLSTLTFNGASFEKTEIKIVNF
jgi:hypothetical protein